MNKSRTIDAHLFWSLAKYIVVFVITMKIFRLKSSVIVKPTDLNPSA